MLSAACALPGATASVAIALHKLELTLLQTFARGIGGGLLQHLPLPRRLGLRLRCRRNVTWQTQVDAIALERLLGGFCTLGSRRRRLRRGCGAP